jgi:hypothetical protein
VPDEPMGCGDELWSQIHDRRAAIQRALSEYRDLLRAESTSKASCSTAAKARIQRRLERSVDEYVRLCRAFEAAGSPAK